MTVHEFSKNFWWKSILVYIFAAELVVYRSFKVNFMFDVLNIKISVHKDKL